MSKYDRLEKLSLITAGIETEVIRELINAGLENLKDMKCIRANTCYSALIPGYANPSGEGVEQADFRKYLEGVYPNIGRPYRNALLLAVRKIAGGEVTGLTPTVPHTQLVKGIGGVKTVYWIEDSPTMSWGLRMDLPDSGVTSRYLRRIMHVDAFFKYGISIRIVQSDGEPDSLKIVKILITPSRNSTSFCLPLAFIPFLKLRLLELYRLSYRVAVMATTVASEGAEAPEEFEETLNRLEGSEEDWEDEDE